MAPSIYYVMDRLLRKRPAERYPSAVALLADLERAIEEIHAGITTSSQAADEKGKGQGKEKKEKGSDIRRTTSRRERSSKGNSNFFKRFFG